MSKPELKVCPFCQEEDQLAVTLIGVKCKRCDFTGPVLGKGDPQDKAVRGWNERVFENGVLVRGGLADCPFCGGTDIKLVQFQDGGRAFQCTKCRAIGPRYDRKNSSGPPEAIEGFAAQGWTYRKETRSGGSA